MAIALKFETNGAQEIGKVTNALGDLRKQIKETKNQMLNFEFGTKEYEEASKKIQQLQGKLGDLGDQMKIEGTGIERMSQSFGLFKESLVNADFDKAKIAFKGLGQAMSAIPIFLLIEGVKALIDNFDEVVKFCKQLFSSFNEDEKAVRQLTKALEKQHEVTETLSKELKRQIEVMEASGASHSKILAKKKELIETQIQEAVITAKLNLAKIQEVQNNDTLTESYYKLTASALRKIGQDEKAEQIEKLIAIEKAERNKENIKAVKDSLELIKDLQTQEKVETLHVQTEINNIYKEKQKERKEMFLEAQKAMDAQVAANKEKALLEYQKEAEIKDLDKQDIIVTTESVEAEKWAIKEHYAQLDREAKAKARDEEQALHLAQTQASFAIASSSINSLQSLSDLAFTMKMNKLQKGSAEEEKAARKQFNMNKGLQIASATISGINGVINALTAPSVIPEPFGTILKVVNAVAIGASTAANIAKIASVQFNSGGGGGASTGGGEASPSSPSSASSASAPQAAPMSLTSLYGTGKSNQGATITSGQNQTANGNQPVFKTYVVGEEITNQQQRDEMIYNRSLI